LILREKIETWLIERGLNKTDIATGMSLLLGKDWEKIDAGELIGRLQAKGYDVPTTVPDFADEIEGLVRGAIDLESAKYRLL
jgi:hypothetical protein